MERGQAEDLLFSEEQRKQLGAEIRRLRTEKGWLQGELARRTGIRQSRLSRIERGHQAPPVSDLLAIRDALGISLDELVCGPAARANNANHWRVLHQHFSRDEIRLLGKALQLLAGMFQGSPSTPARPEGGAR
jgi:transcriptional regulator with XRE-family HTH domain